MAGDDGWPGRDPTRGTWDPTQFADSRYFYGTRSLLVLVYATSGTRRAMSPLPKPSPCPNYRYGDT
eukprot:scaffold71532_cov17-Prasinocladus_malaysianus.AAC.1